MAKELPYYKHEPSEWLEGEIQICSDSAIVCFTNLRDGYWLKLGCMSYAFALHKYCRKDESIIKELIDNGIIDLDGENIIIKFLDNQLKEFNGVSQKRKQAAEKRWQNNKEDANALHLHSTSNAIKEDKRKKDKKKEENKTIPPLSEFLEYVKTIEEFSTKFDSLKFSIQSKYESWVENGWNDGHNKEIKNWKSKIKNTLPHLKPIYQSNNQNNEQRKQQLGEITAELRRYDPEL